MPVWPNALVGVGLALSVFAAQALVRGTVSVTHLPYEAQNTERLIRAGGPFPYPKDGMVFGNRERELPYQPRGYYREYTVSAPGQRFPGPRRLITGGQEALGAEPEIWFYSADHYESFCELAVS
jgi:ribonuclease T1